MVWITAPTGRREFAESNSCHSPDQSREADSRSVASCVLQPALGQSHPSRVDGYSVKRAARRGSSHRCRDSIMKTTDEPSGEQKGLACPMSYVSEHTVEFYLVPWMRRILTPTFPASLAFYYWALREGSIQSREAMCPEPVRLIAVYPRRPKPYGDPRNPIMKINYELFSSAAKFRSVGVPVFVAGPLISSIFELANGTDFLCYLLRGDDEDVGDMEVQMRTPLMANASDDSPVIGPLTGEDICRIAMTNTAPVQWERAIEMINEFRRMDRIHNMWPFVHGYKPLYFALWKAMPAGSVQLSNRGVMSTV
jgi:hypothetical protein